jgi:REP element-mobilizing transposase RayT
MSNHVHLLVREKEDTISRIMSRIETSYAKRQVVYNQKYDRSCFSQVNKFLRDG